MGDSADTETETDVNTVTASLGSIADDTYDYINSLLTNPTVIIILIVVLVIYVIIFMTLGGNNSAVSMDSSDNVSNSSSNTIYVIIIAFFILLVALNGIQYFFGMDILASIKNLFTGNPEVDITVTDTKTTQSVIPELKLNPQVFNIPGNNYGYNDAKTLCAAYGARLANYKEVENTYNSGGEWCNYGWSDGQMALFPTQQKTYDELQKIEGHENDCGRPGVNGGYIANPAVKFGVNCYGYKPAMNSTEEQLMETEPLYPKTLKDIAMEARVKYWKDRLSEILVSPFNHNTWAKI
jgi:Extracellular link domain